MRRIVVTNFSTSPGRHLKGHFFGKDIFLDGVDLFLPGCFQQAPLGSTRYQSWLELQSPGFMHYELDLRQREAVVELIREIRPSAIVHAPRGLAAESGPDDFILTGTRNLLEAAREFVWQSPFVYFSTSRVYGDSANLISREESESRYDFADSLHAQGIEEDFPVTPSPDPACATAVAADLLVQEYGRRHDLPTCCLRGPVPTDPSNPDVALYDPLARLVQASIDGEEFPVSENGLKQVREALHAADAGAFVELFCANPRVAEVYNLGGGRENSYSVLEASRLIEERTGRPVRFAVGGEISPGEPSCYFSDLRKAQAHYPGWRVTRSLPQIIDELVEPTSAFTR